MGAPRGRSLCAFTWILAEHNGRRDRRRARQDGDLRAVLISSILSSLSFLSSVLASRRSELTWRASEALLILHYGQGTNSREIPYRSRGTPGNGPDTAPGSTSALSRGTPTFFSHGRRRWEDRSSDRGYRASIDIPMPSDKRPGQAATIFSQFVIAITIPLRATIIAVSVVFLSRRTSGRDNRPWCTRLLLYIRRILLIEIWQWGITFRAEQKSSPSVTSSVRSSFNSTHDSCRPIKYDNTPTVKYRKSRACRIYIAGFAKKKKKIDAISADFKTAVLENSRSMRLSRARCWWMARGYENSETHLFLSLYWRCDILINIIQQLYNNDIIADVVEDNSVDHPPGDPFLSSFIAMRLACFLTREKLVGSAAYTALKAEV